MSKSWDLGFRIEEISRVTKIIFNIEINKATILLKL